MPRRRWEAFNTGTPIRCSVACNGMGCPACAAPVPPDGLAMLVLRVLEAVVGTSLLSIALATALIRGGADASPGANDAEPDAGVPSRTLDEG